MCTLLLPNRITTSIEGYNYLSNLFYEIDDLAQKHETIHIDFSQCIQFDGNLCAAMGAIFDSFYTKTKIMIHLPKERSVRRVLSRNQFLRAWKVDTKVQERENYVKYSKFKRTDEEGFKQYIDKELIAKQLFPAHTKDVGDNLVESIYEIYANAMMHGETEYVYSCGEYKESDKTFEMAIVDLGRTIATNVNTYLYRKEQLPPRSDCDAILWAFVKGNTTKENPGGLGLSLLQEFVKLNEGSLHMVSASGFIEYSNNQFRSHPLDKQFPGTIVNIKFNFNDPKNYWMSSEKPDLNNLL